MELERRTKGRALSGPLNLLQTALLSRVNLFRKTRTWFCVVAAVVDSCLWEHLLCVCRKHWKRSQHGGQWPDDTGGQRFLRLIHLLLQVQELPRRHQTLHTQQDQDEIGMAGSDGMALVTRICTIAGAF